MNQKPPHIHLHLGAHKTATTYLQNLLAANRDALAAQGVHFRPLDDIRNGLTDNLNLPWPKVKGDKRLPKNFEAAESWFNDVVDRATVAEGHTIILSDENLLTGHLRKLRSGRLDLDAELQLPNLRALAKNMPIRVFFSVRNQADVANSMFSERIASGLERIVKPEQVRRAWLENRPRWTPLITKFCDAFPNAPITIWQFEAFRELQPRVLDLLCCSAKLPVPPHAERHRASPSAADTLRLLHLHETEGPRARINAAGLVREKYNKQAGDPPYSLWSPDEAAGFTADYDEDIRLISQMGPQVTLLTP